MLGGAYAAKRWRDNYDFVQGAWVGDDARVRRYLDAGIDPNVRGLKGLSAIQIAAHNGHTDTVRLLLERGANPVDGIGNAIMTDRPDIVRLLLRHGVRVSSHYSRWAKTPLAMAREQGSPKVRAMVEAAAKREQRRR